MNGHRLVHVWIFEANISGLLYFSHLIYSQRISYCMWSSAILLASSMESPISTSLALGIQMRMLVPELFFCGAWVKN